MKDLILDNATGFIVADKMFTMYMQTEEKIFPEWLKMLVCKSNKENKAIPKSSMPV